MARKSVGEAVAKIQSSRTAALAIASKCLGGRIGQGFIHRECLNLVATEQFACVGGAIAAEADAGDHQKLGPVWSGDAPTGYPRQGFQVLHGVALTQQNGNQCAGIDERVNRGGHARRSR
ncbi:MAG: hypothetical protein IPI44_18715 [Sulfuritalea sp.]|nr:hypothetical protein [Sulfuritalea sp.]